MKRKTFIPVVALAALLTVGPLAQGSTTAAGRYDSQIQASVTQKLDDKSEFKNVQSTVEDGIITLTGQVDRYRDKLDAEKKARKSDKQVKGVRNLIEVAGPTVSDTELQSKLEKKLAYDRVGYFSNAFNVLGLNVKDGVVTLSGETMDYPSYNSALATVQNMNGVKDVVDNVKVARTSIYDDELRVRLYRAIYGDSVLSKYSMDPVKPIRILVNGGHVGLYGEVDSTMDKQIAEMRARGVFGGFTVENHLTTPNQVEAR
jgi:hyperosmotically inducible periplasmic protein